MHTMQCCSDLGSATGHFISNGMIFGARGNIYQAKSNYHLTLLSKYFNKTFCSFTTTKLITDTVMKIV